MDQTTATTHNPLAKHFRQPSIYLKLPSGGTHWPEGSIDLPMTGEIAILPMSTKDEIVLKTPDALLNGQGVVDVIENCCPNIKDAWKMPSIDVDAVIIAIRIASYGNQMEFMSECPHCKTSNDYAVDLGVILSNITAPNYNNKLEVNGLKFKLRPQPYFSMNKRSMIAYEEQQILRSLGTLEDNPEEAKRLFNENLNKLVDLNIQMLADSTDYIESEDSSIVSDAAFIQEFYKNCDTKLVKVILAKLDEHGLYGGIKPVNVACHNEECTKEFDINITFDFASFFAKGS